MRAQLISSLDITNDYIFWSKSCDQNIEKIKKKTTKFLMEKSVTIGLYGYDFANMNVNYLLPYETKCWQNVTHILQAKNL